MTQELLNDARELLHSLTRCCQVFLRNHQPYTCTGGALMFIVKDDRPDDSCSINPPVVKDSEGNTIPNAQLTYELVSDNEDAVSVLNFDNTALTFNTHYGSPGVANVNCMAHYNDALVASFGAQFTVTTGDAATISGGGITIEGLTEA